MTTLLIVFITIVLFICLEVFFAKIGIIYASKIIKEAINVACYIDTYHYSKDEVERIKLGQQRFAENVLKNIDNSYTREKCDYIFWVFYTQIFNKLLKCIPIDIIRHNNRCLAEGERRGTERFIDNYLIEQEQQYTKYLTEHEQQEINDRQNVAEENRNI